MNARKPEVAEPPPVFSVLDDRLTCVSPDRVRVRHALWMQGMEKENVAPGHPSIRSKADHDVVRR